MCVRGGICREGGTPSSAAGLRRLPAMRPPPPTPGHKGRNKRGEKTPGTREEPGTLTQGAPVFPGSGSSRLGIEPKTPGSLVQDPTTRPIGDLIPTIGGSGAHPCQGWDP